MTAPLEYKHMPATFDPNTMQVYVLGVPLSRGSLVIVNDVPEYPVGLVKSLHMAGYLVSRVGSRFTRPADLNNL